MIWMNAQLIINSIMPLTLYWNIISQPARSCMVLIAIGKIQAKVVTVDLLSNQTQTKEYLEMNPFGKVPFIIHDQLKLGESNAILTYMCEAFPQQLAIYYGDSPKSRARVNQYLSWYQNTFRPALFRIIQHKVDEGLKRGLRVYAYQIKNAERQMQQSLTLLDQLLQREKTRFIAGDHLTIADLQFFHEVTNMLVYQIPFSEYSFVTQWYKRVLQNEQVHKVHEQFLKLVPLLAGTVKKVKIEQ